MNFWKDKIEDGFLNEFTIETVTIRYVARMGKLPQ